MQKNALWQGEFSKIQKYFLPTSEDLKTNNKKDVKEIKKIMENIHKGWRWIPEESGRWSNIRKDRKHSYDGDITSSNVGITSQETTYDDYITYLGEISDKFQEYLSKTNSKLLSSEILKIQSIPYSTEIMLLNF